VSVIKIQGSPGGGGAFTISSPATNADHTLTLPDADSVIAGTGGAQTLTNKTLSSPLTMATSMLTSPGVVATTSGTSVVIATNLPSWVRSVSFVFYLLSTNGTSAILIQFGTGSTPTWVTTGYVSGSDNYTSAVSPATSTQGFRVGRSTGAGNSTTAIYTFFRAGTSNTWVGQLNGILDAGTSLVFGGGRVTLASELTAIRVTTAGGANLFDAGSATIWYE
jgi:hypothetical protein